MLEEILKYKKTLTGILVVFVVFIFYNSFIKPEESNEVLQRQALSPQDIPAAQEILALLTDLRALELPSELFSRPAFQNLEDFSLPLPAEPVGRQNPFAPLGAEPAPSGDEQDDEESQSAEGQNGQSQEGF